MNEVAIKNLEKRFSEIIGAKDIYDETISLAIFDYFEMCQKATISSPAWHEFYHQMHQEWEKELYKAEEKFGRNLTPPAGRRPRPPLKKPSGFLRSYFPTQRLQF